MKWNDEFIQWQQRFYNSAKWIKLRNEVREEREMRCAMCGRLIRGRPIVDHIKEITPDNKEDESITLNKGNLQLLCLDCHNVKTFKGRLRYYTIEEDDFDLKKRKDINLF